ncbi:hypothetical protein BJ165DRAFT_1409239 [Panaeolus papilionaceus]|nr:hypothetical protein BJ165DRAFT_1409239 [Panaeolus papilionaceus]
MYMSTPKPLSLPTDAYSFKFLFACSSLRSFEGNIPSSELAIALEGVIEGRAISGRIGMLVFNIKHPVRLELLRGNSRMSYSKQIMWGAMYKDKKGNQDVDTRPLTKKPYRCSARLNWRRFFVLFNLGVGLRKVSVRHPSEELEAIRSSHLRGAGEGDHSFIDFLLYLFLRGEEHDLRREKASQLVIEFRFSMRKSRYAYEYVDMWHASVVEWSMMREKNMVNGLLTAAMGSIAEPAVKDESSVQDLSLGYTTRSCGVYRGEWRSEDFRDATSTMTLVESQSKANDVGSVCAGFKIMRFRRKAKEKGSQKYEATQRTERGHRG